MRRIQFLVWIMALLPSIGLAQDAATTDDKPSDKKEVSPLRKLMDESLSWEELFVNERSATPMTVKVSLRDVTTTPSSGTPIDSRRKTIRDSPISLSAARWA